MSSLTPELPTASPPSPIKSIMAMLVLILVLAALDQTVLSTALPVMARELPGHLPLAWAFSSYLLAATVVILLYGRLADLVGRKPMLLFSIGLFVLGSLACALSQNLLQLVLARTLQGAGGGGLMTLTMLVVADLFSLQERGRYQGMLGAAYGIATMFGPLAGGWLTEHMSWRWAFSLNVPLGLLAFAVLAATLRPRRPAAHPTAAQQSVDGLGSLLMAVSLVTLLLATQHDGLGLPTSASSGLLSTVAVITGAAFLWRQHRAAHPLLPLSLFGRADYAAAAVLSTATGVALYAAVVFLPQYLQTARHLSPTTAAWYLLPLMAGMTLAAITSGKLLRARKPPRQLATAASGLMVLGFVLLALALRFFEDAPLAISACLAPLGFGVGLLFPIVSVVSQRSAPTMLLGIATATPVMLRNLGGAVGVALLASLLHSRIAAGVAPLQWVFVCAAGVSGVALLVCRWLPMNLQPVAAPVRISAQNDPAFS